MHGGNAGQHNADQRCVFERVQADGRLSGAWASGGLRAASGRPSPLYQAGPGASLGLGQVAPKQLALDPVPGHHEAVAERDLR